MSDSPKPLSPTELAALVEELDLVMKEAATLRGEVTWQLAEHRERQRQLAPVGRKQRREPSA